MRFANNFRRIAGRGAVQMCLLIMLSLTGCQSPTESQKATDSPPTGRASTRPASAADGMAQQDGKLVNEALEKQQQKPNYRPPRPNNGRVGSGVVDQPTNRR